jgi:hypothetical protein
LLLIDGVPRLPVLDGRWNPYGYLTGNSISDADTGVLAVELAGDGDTFGDINGESATSAQQQALVSDNTFAGSVDTEANVQADPN